MSRSNKEARLSHSGITIETGHGGLKRNKTPNRGASIKPKQKKNKYVTAVAESLAKGAKGAKGAADDEGATPMDSDTQAWKQIGDAGESIALERKRRRAAKSTDSAAAKDFVA
jgi:hypothetical protein